jgi:hypothetical protein
MPSSEAIRWEGPAGKKPPHPPKIHPGALMLPPLDKYGISLLQESHEVDSLVTILMIRKLRLRGVAQLIKAELA